MKTVFRIMPLIILPLTINFPTVSLLRTHLKHLLHVLHYLNSSSSQTGGVYLLDDLQLLLPGSSRPAQAPVYQRSSKDPGEDQTPVLRHAPE